MLALEINKLAMLGGDKLLDISCIRTATDLKYRKSRARKETRRKKVGYSVRFVISKVHQAEGTFLKKKDFVSMSLSGSAPRDYAIQ